MKAHQLLVLVLSSIFSVSYGMRQVELDNVEPLQQLSTFNGYQFGNTLGQDGIYSFYYLLPTSSRSEQRTASGEVSGQYAFVAPEGNEFEFRYNAGNEGYQVESNALPVPPEDTDEVKRAKEEFFAAYKKALELAGSDEDYEEGSEEEDSEEEDLEEEDSEEDSSEESDEDSSEETYYSSQSSEEDSSEEDSEEGSEEGSEESSEESSEEGSEEGSEEKSSEDDEKEEEGEGEKDISERPTFGYRGLVQPSGFGQKIQKPYPYYYSR